MPNFDITKHKLWDDDAWIEGEYCSTPSIKILTLRVDKYGIDLNKDDAVAIAKHFGLIGEDCNCNEEGCELCSFDY